MQFLLDTNICIYLIKRQPIQVLVQLQRQPMGAVGISAITLAELEYGVSKSAFPERNRIALTEFVAPLEVVAFDDAAASEYGALRRTLEQKGQLIGSMDLLIASQGLALSATLVTNNEKEFRRVPGLKIENWTR
jgi:tRNA(fMet)-specific endonuclease VapC